MCDSRLFIPPLSVAEQWKWTVKSEKGTAEADNNNLGRAITLFENTDEGSFENLNFLIRFSPVFWLANHQMITR